MACGCRFSAYIECHIELSPQCSTTSWQRTGSICLDDLSVVSESASNECGLHIVAFDVDTCSAVNVTVFNATDRQTVLEDVGRFVRGLPMGMPIAAHSSCPVPAPTAVGVLSIVGGSNNISFPSGDSKFAFVGQTGYPLKTLTVADGCGTSPMQLCVVVNGGRALIAPSALRFH